MFPIFLLLSYKCDQIVRCWYVLEKKKKKKKAKKKKLIAVNIEEEVKVNEEVEKLLNTQINQSIYLDNLNYDDDAIDDDDDNDDDIGAPSHTKMISNNHQIIKTGNSCMSMSFELFILYSQKDGEKMIIKQKNCYLSFLLLFFSHAYLAVVNSNVRHVVNKQQEKREEATELEEKNKKKKTTTKSINQLSNAQQQTASSAVLKIGLSSEKKKKR